MEKGCSGVARILGMAVCAGHAPEGMAGRLELMFFFFFLLLTESRFFVFIRG